MAGINKNFVVKNGLEVKSNLILADADKNSVGIGTSNINYKLHVRGGIGATDLIVTGIATFPYLSLTGTVAAGSSLGASGQFLTRSGSGVTWSDFPSYRTSQTFTATSSQTTFAFTYNVGFLDVYINGVRLTETEYTAVDGTQVILNQPCFGDETVDFITYGASAPGYAFTGIYGISVAEEGSYVGTPGGILSLNFVGSAVTAVGSGAGVTVYITDTSGGNAISYWEQTASGIHTLSNVGIGTTNPTSTLTVKGNTFTNQLSVSGVSTLGTVTGATYYGDASNAADGRWNLSASGTDHYIFSGIGITAGLQNDPTLHLQRGRVYEFVNEMGAHPFQIQLDYQNTSGQPYNVGVVNNGVSNGTLRWEVPFNAPNTLYYQCTSHVGMSGTIHIAPSGYDEPIGFRTTRTVTTSSLGAGSSESVSIQGFKTYGLLKVDIGNAAWVTLYTDSASRTADASARTHLQDPEPGSGVIAEVYTETTGSSSFKMSPGVIGWNNDSPTENTIYLRVLNNESTSTAIGVTITLVKMED